MALVSQIDLLAERILELKEQFKQSFTKELLLFKWQVGKEIFVQRVGQDDLTLRELEKRTGFSRADLAQDRLPSKLKVRNISHRRGNPWVIIQNLIKLSNKTEKNKNEC